MFVLRRSNLCIVHGLKTFLLLLSLLCSEFFLGQNFIRFKDLSYLSRAAYDVIQFSKFLIDPCYLKLISPHEASFLLFHLPKLVVP